MQRLAAWLRPPPFRGRCALVVALAGLPALAAAAGGCAPPRQVVERFVPADCAACWAEAGETLPASTWALDWIVPSPAGGDAPLASGALGEADERLTALGAAEVRRDATHVVVATPLDPARLKLQVTGGPAWNGYLGLELRSRGRPPAGAVAYVALVEDVPAGSEGTPIERHLLRAVAGPLPLAADGGPSSQLRALRIPDGARAERLQGVAWWVDAGQRIGGLAREGCPTARER